MPLPGAYRETYDYMQLAAIVLETVMGCMH